MLNKDDFSFFRRLVEAPSPSGFEGPAQEVIRTYLQPHVDQIEIDVLGNLKAHLPGQGGPRVMLAAHCDEIGFMVQYVGDDGFLSFAAIGGIDPHLVPGQRVQIHAASGVVPGVIGKKAIHLIEAKDRDKLIPIKELYIDIGCSSREEVESLIRVGDPVTFATGVTRLRNNTLTSRALDDKMGAFIVCQVLKRIAAAGGSLADLFAVTTVQEEIGLRGAAACGYEIHPDVAIVVEVTHATDTPDVDARQIGRVELGKGPVLPRGANINPVLFERMRTTADRLQIPLQFTGAPRATGTDANVLQLARGGVATALVGIPLRYMHTAVETLNETDLQAAIDLLTATILALQVDENFSPD